MPNFSVGPTQTVTGSSQSDTYVVDPNNLTLATIIDSGGAADVLVVYDRPGRTAGEFLVEGNYLVWRNYEGDTVRIQLNQDGTSPIEFLEWQRLPEDGNPYTQRTKIVMPGQAMTDPDSSVALSAGNDSFAAPVLALAQTAWTDVYGNDGDDTLTGSANYNVYLYGGDGNDVISGAGSWGDYFYGDAGDDRMAGLAGDDSLDGYLGNDQLDGGTGDDTLSGGEGNDQLTGGAGNDAFTGGNGIDRAFFNGAAAFTVNLSLTTAQNTGQGTDILSGVEHVTSGSGNDSLTGNTQANSLTSGAGNDTLSGLGGNDTLTGGTGADLLRAGTGADRLIGGIGRDVLVGGTDAQGDVFDFNTITETVVGAARDVVQNFTRQSDRIDLSTIDADTTANGNDSFSFAAQTATAHSVWYVVSGSNVIVRGDVNGDTTADFEILVQGLTALGTGDFVL